MKLIRRKNCLSQSECWSLGRRFFSATVDYWYNIPTVAFDSNWVISICWTGYKTWSVIFA